MYASVAPHSSAVEEEPRTGAGRERGGINPDSIGWPSTGGQRLLALCCREDRAARPASITVMEGTTDASESLSRRSIGHHHVHRAVGWLGSSWALTPRQSRRVTSGPITHSQFSHTGLQQIASLSDSVISLKTNRLSVNAQ